MRFKCTLHFTFPVSVFLLGCTRPRIRNPHGKMNVIWPAGKCLESNDFCSGTIRAQAGNMMSWSGLSWPLFFLHRARRSGTSLVLVASLRFHPIKGGPFCWNHDCSHPHRTLSEKLVSKEFCDPATGNRIPS